MRLLGSLAVFTIYLCSYAESLSSHGKNVCHHTVTFKVATQERYHVHCKFLGLGRCTRYRTKYVTNSRIVYECCPGWRSSNNVDCSLAICYGRDKRNGACSEKGSCVSPNSCSCQTGYTGAQCEKCLDARGDPDHSIWWRNRDNPDCALTCSWMNQWCWPGDCPEDRFKTSCRCRKGFVKKSTSSYTKCDLVEKPQLLTCRIGMTDIQNRVRNSTHGSNTGCQNESDTYVNLHPESVYLQFSSKFDDIYIKNPPNYISQQGYGIVASKATWTKRSVSGHESSLSTIKLSGGNDCSKALGNTSPSPSLTCSRTVSAPTRMHDGEWLCIQFSATGGGFYKYQDFDRHYKGIQTYTPQTSTKHLCFRYDISKPTHCSKLRTGRCSSQPLELSTRITRTGSIHVKTSGWTDPIPTGGKSDTASGLKYIKLQVLKTTNKQNMIDVLHTPLKGLDLTYNTSVLDKSINLPSAYGLYAVILEVLDKAGNIQYVRRLVLHDSLSKLIKVSSKPLRVVSATPKSSYRWQTSLRPVCIDWKGRYYNDKMKANKLLNPVRPQAEVTRDFDQTTGTLPISGTYNIDGIIEVMYSFSVNQVAHTTPHWTKVPHFTNQSLCISPQLADGDTCDISIRLKDIANHYINESVHVNIDSTGPDISNMWLVKDGNKQVYVHDNPDLSAMVLQFDVMDPHSGVTSVEWYLGTKDSSDDLGQGVLPVEKLNGTACASRSGCYCPSVGECQYHNYTVNLNKLVANKANGAQHNQAVYFTVRATNGAYLQSIDHLDILVDTSPPEAGTVKEGAVDGPDVEYTSENTVLVNWAGFIDHESGIGHYLVSLAPTCLTLDEMKNMTDTIRIPGSMNIAQLTIQKAMKKYHTTVVAFNNAFSPSKAACSDGIIKDTSSPSLGNVTLKGAQTSQEHVECLNGDLWVVTRNLTLKSVEKTSKCSQRCKSKSTPTIANVFPKSYIIVNDTELADSLCGSLGPIADSLIFLPSDKIDLHWNYPENGGHLKDVFVGFGSDKSTTYDPDILDYASSKGRHSFKLNHAGFAGKNIFYIFLKAVNRAGTSAVVTFGPVMIDNTPPVITEKITPKSSGDFVMISWHNDTFADPEQQDSQFTVLYRIMHNGQHVTPILQTPKHITKTCQIHGHAGCIRYPIKRLKEMDSELNKPFLFELYVYNSAGHFTIVNTEKITVPSRFPPGHGIVYDIDPMHEGGKDDVDFHSTLKKSCVRWNGFSHHRNVQFEVALGSSANGSDISPFRHVNNESACVTAPGLKPRMKYFATVRATCSGGTSYASSDGFIIIDQPNDDRYILEVFDGTACDDHSSETSGLVPETSRSYKPAASLHIGQRYIVEFRPSLNGKITAHDVLSMSSINVGGKKKNTYQFVPLTHYPRFNITNSADDISNSTIRMCSLDIDYNLSKNKVSSHWHYDGPWKVLTTHFEAALKERMHCANNSQCYKTLSTVFVNNRTDYADFMDIVLEHGKVYHVYVRPCFDTVCLPWKSSDGVKVISGLPKVTITPTFTTRAKSSCHDVAIHVDSVKCEEEPGDSGTLIYQWAATDKHNNPFTSWQTDQSLAKGQSDVCLEDHIESRSTINICVRVICPSGLSDTSCQTLHHTRKQGSRLVEVDQNDIQEIKEMIDKLETGNISSFEIDVAESNIKLVGVMGGLEGKNAWYLMKEPHIPSTCKADDKCITSVDAVGPVAYFHDLELLDGVKYYICMQSMPIAQNSSRISECGDGVIIDDLPPKQGEVRVLNLRNGFLTEWDVLVIDWSGFRDQKLFLKDTDSGISYYSYAIGTYPGGQDVQAFTNVGLAHNAHIPNITLANGETFYVTLKAFDRLGHSTSATSDAALVDVTPPKTGDIFIGDILESHSVVSGDRLTVHWAGFEDPESGILSTYLAIGSTITGALSPFKKYTGTFADINMNGFTDGHEYFARIMITNRAGMTSMAVSNPFTVDTSPPSIGVVADGEKGYELDYQTTTGRYSCYWSGFDDPHSGLMSFHVSVGTQPYLDDVQTTTHAGLGSELSWAGDLPVGIQLYCSVEACNHAGLCSKSASDGIILDNSPPVPGMAFVGHDGQHHKYHGHVSTLTAQWFGFEDPETGINHFDWCVGTSPGKCDVLPSISNLLSDSVLKTGLKLPSGHPLYVTVNATNPAGLVATSTSDSFIVDTSPPVAKEKPTFTSPYSKNISAVNVQWENSMLHLRWKFTDVDSPIQRHLVSLSTHNDGASAVESIHLGTQDSTTILFEAGNLMRSGDVYTATVTACNAADLCSTATSNQIRIDSTPPQMGGFKSPLAWENAIEKGVSKTRVNLKWLGFVDTESGIQVYHISVSRTFDGNELSRGIVEMKHDNNSTEQSSSFILSDQIKTGENIILTISATNTAGLSSGVGKMTVAAVASDAKHTKGTLELQRHSCSVHYCTGDCTCGILGQHCQLNSSKQECPGPTTKWKSTDVVVHLGLESDTTVTSSSSCLNAHWEASSSQVLNKITRFQWSFGEKEDRPENDTLTTIWRDVGKGTSVIHCLPNGESLHHGTEYTIYVKAWFSFSEYAVFQSRSILVDHTPPAVQRAKSPLDSDVSCKMDFEYFSHGQPIRACWEGVFNDTQTTLKGFEISLGSSPGGDEIIQAKFTGNATSYPIPVGLLKGGTKYYSSIRATNSAGLQTVAVSDGFVVDDAPPVAGVVFNTDRHKNIEFQSSNTTLKASWHGFEDYHSYVQRFEIAVLKEGEHIQDSMFKYHGMENEITIENLKLEEKKRYRIAVRAVDAAGLRSSTAESPSILIDTSAPKAFKCISFHDKKLSFTRRRYQSRQYDAIALNAVEHLQENTFYHITVRGVLDIHMSRVIFSLGSLHIPAMFERNISVIQASHSFLVSHSGLTNITISITGTNASHAVDVQLGVCQNVAETEPTDAITVWQIRPSVVAVCARVIDHESGTRSVWLGAGTSKGGYQIRALSPTSVSNHEMILVEEPHGSPVHVTVMAENNAGLRTIFTSKPITIDHTPPKMTTSQATAAFQTHNVFLKMRWQVEDAESGINTCLCTYGAHPLSYEDHTWEKSQSLTHCELKNISAPHDSVLYVWARCINNVNLETVIKSQPLHLVNPPPALLQNSLKVIVDNKIPFPSKVQAYTDRVEFAWQEANTPWIGTYECRLLEHGKPVANWVSTGKKTYATLDGLSLRDGHVYDIQVRAVNAGSQYSNVLNSTIAVESRSPSTTGVKPTATLVKGHLNVDWPRVFDDLKMQTRYETTIGTRQGFNDIVRNRVSFDTHLTTITHANVHEIFVTIKANFVTGKFGIYSHVVSLH
ncbi:uncharacterized protein [Haliotis cracherodii]|uniref:uncharacterized protein n=1 Tax=Haliotis cracherodii TaxID=6455 RepID=UPI0039EAE20A